MNEPLQEEFWHALKTGTLSDFFKKYDSGVVEEEVYEPNPKIWDGLLDDFSRARSWLESIECEGNCTIWSEATKTSCNTSAQIRIQDVELTFYPDELECVFKKADYINIFADDNSNEVIMTVIYKNAFVRIDNE